jgi:RNA polymerase sigma factor (sigma-70 family)
LTSLEVLQAPLDREGGAFDVEDERTEAPTAFASRHELEKDIQRAIDRLSPKMRAIIVLRYLESLSYDEIAETLDISLGTVKSRLSRAHAALDRELTPIVDRHFIHEEGR